MEVHNYTTVSGLITNLDNETYIIDWDYIEYLGNIAFYMMMCGSYVLPPIGICGSFLTLIVLFRVKLPSNGTSEYLITISIIDMTHLIFTLIHMTLKVFEVFIDFTCKLDFFMLYMTALMSYMLVVAMAIDRVIAIRIPHKAQIWCTPQRAKRNIIIIFFMEAMLCSTAFVFWKSIFPGFDCVRDYSYSTLMDIVGIIAFSQSLTAVVVLFTCSSLIIYSLRKQRNQMSHLHKIGSTEIMDQRNKKDAQIFTMLISIAFLFILTNIPILSLQISDTIGVWPKVRPWSTVHTLLYESFAVLTAMNHTLNFFLYFLSAQFFRKEVWKLFCCVSETQ